MNKIISIQDSQGTILTDKEDIYIEAIHFFSKYFKAPQQDLTSREDILGVIPSCVLVFQKQALIREVSLEEVKTVLFGLGGDKAQGPDRFPTLFYQKCWILLAKYIWEVVEESRRAKFVLKYFNNTFIALILKKEDTKNFNDFCPISLCNTIYKVISKVMANRLKEVLDFFLSRTKWLLS